MRGVVERNVIVRFVMMVVVRATGVNVIVLVRVRMVVRVTMHVRKW